MLETIIATIIISAVGILAHFLYDLTRHNRIIGLFTAVNESTWEHIKIAITPIILFSLYDGFVYGVQPNYFLAKLASLLVPVICIPLIFYTYKAIIKKPVLAVDILTFFFAVFLSQFVFKWIIGLPAIPYICQYFACIGTFIFFGAYTLLTLMPLKTFIFKDPISKKYGFPAHTEIFNPFKKHKSK